MSEKPEIDFIDGPSPNELVIEDIVEGTGPVAAASDTVEVHYVGVDFSTGEQFDASWDRGSRLSFRCRGSLRDGKRESPA